MAEGPSIPRGARYPAIGLHDSFTEYSDAYQLAAKALWNAVSHTDGHPHPDHLSYPILFLVHHCLESELKDAITLSYSIRHMLGKEAPESPKWIHSLVPLLREMMTTLADTPGYEKFGVGEENEELFEDLDSFAPGGVVLRYPHFTTPKKPAGDLERAAVVDIPGVMKAFDDIHWLMVGLISALIETDHEIWQAHREGE